MAQPGVLHATPPSLTAADAERLAHELFGVDGPAEPMVSERDQNFRIGGDWVLKVSNPAEDPAVVEMEVAATQHVATVDPGLPVPLPRPALNGSPIAVARVTGAEHRVRLLPLVAGRNPDPAELTSGQLREIGEVTGRLSHALRGFFHPAAGRPILWDQKHLPDLAEHVPLIGDERRRAQVERILERFMERVLPRLPALRAQVIHNDVTLDNLLVGEDGHVSGVIDFGDMAHTALLLDVPATLQSLVRRREDIFAAAAHFLPGYTSIVPLEPDEADLLGDLLAGRMAQTILISVWRTRAYPQNAYITGWEEPAWALLDQLEAAGLDEAGRRLAAMALSAGPGVASGRADDDERLLARRERVLGPALAPLSYRRPLHLVRGSGAWMHDAQGRAYLDAYNNVPVVGHAHPRVAAAIARQAATLNTNTRYLHGAVVELAERLAATMPDGLDTVMFVNSGSEANDLAWRLARAVTGAEGALVTEWAYHGVTAAIDDLSPSEWRAGRQPRTVETFPAPDTFRGAAPAVGDGVAAAVERLAARGVRPALLMVDSLFTSDGIFAAPPGTMEAAIAEARGAGALYVADEVQAGHGRTGEGLWSFTAWDAVPDIVTLGKPMGNGHPIAAVVTRHEIAERLAAETEFFSTFGGNPVACAAALAVLDVIADERLVENASATGAGLRQALTELQPRHRSILDVRGRGLMVGVELPDAEVAARVRDQMRERGVLIGTTRREGNVLKIRPPLCITTEEGEILVERLDEVLGSAAS
ncbi:MAG TPA: aminotransferase class III-fold pyridoxal phosphate-dependent enzyme [Candidatus Limnocylindria bacterium]